jgi:large subunit ribosomal protein L10
MNLDEKKQIVEDLHDRFSRSKVVIAADYKGLDVAMINDLRRKLRDAGVEFKVVKNTLLSRASENTDIAQIRDHFKGPSAIALSYDDPVAPAKVLTAFAKENEKFEIKIGVLEDQVIDLDRIKALASLPSREALIGQLLSVMNGVPSGFVRTISAIPGQFLNVLQAIKEQKEAA